MDTSLKTTLTDLLGIKHPVLLAPMAGVSGGRLAAAVSRAGGLGIIGGGYGDSAWLGEQLAQCKGERFGVGFIAWALQRQPELLRQALEARPLAVLLSFAALDELATQVRDADAILIAQVQTVQQAREVVAQGAQVVVAQGAEAGGHSGLRGTLALVPAIVDAITPLPVVAAGGIADGRGLAAALMLGASGVMCGTVFYAATESLAHAQAKQRLVEASGDDTVKSVLFDLVRDRRWPPGPWQLRTLRNRFSDRWANDLAGLRSTLPAEQDHYAKANTLGDFDVAAVIAGEVADLVKSVLPAQQIVQSMVVRCSELLSAAPSCFIT